MYALSEIIFHNGHFRRNGNFDRMPSLLREDGRLNHDELVSLLYPETHEAGSEIGFRV